MDFVWWRDGWWREGLLVAWQVGWWQNSLVARQPDTDGDGGDSQTHKSIKLKQRKTQP